MHCFIMLRKWLAMSLVVVAMSALASTDANAWWGHWRGGYGCGYGCGYGWGGYGGACYGGCGWAGMRYGWAPYACNYGWGPNAYCGGAYSIGCGYAVNIGCGPAYMSVVKPTGTVIEPMTPMSKNDAAEIDVSVPAEASVYVNGSPTKLTGAQRRFISGGLQAGKSYTYTVEARLPRGSETINRTRTVSVTAGQRVAVAFDFTSNVADAAPLQTSLALHVPAEAKVFLNGQPTTSTGVTRSFVTTLLAAGEKYDDYQIRVEFERDGQKLVRERTISLTAGQEHDLAIDFDAPTVATASAR